MLIFVANASFLSLDAEKLLKVTNNSDGKDKHDLIESLRQQIQNEEKELEKEEKMNKNFERLVQFVNFLGQVDAFLSERTKNVIKKLAKLTREDEDMYNDKNK